MTHEFPTAWKRGLYEAIARRRDMRTFLPDPIPDAVLARILFAANQAGSVGFSQPWTFLVVRDGALRAELHAHVTEERLRGAEAFDGERREKYLAMKLEGVVDAPLNICVACDRERFGPAILGRNTIADVDVYSTVGAVQNLWLAARVEGVGVGWVSLLENEFVSRLLELPPHVLPVAYLCLGYVEEFPERPMLESKGWLPKLSLADVVRGDRWGDPPSPSLAEALRLPGVIDTLEGER